MKIILLIFLMLIPTVTVSNNIPNILLHKNRYVTIINQAMLKRIFTLQETRWPNGNLINVFIQPLDSSANKYFVHNRLNMTTYRYKILLDNIRTTPNEFSLTEVPNDIEMVLNIRHIPDSIGYSNNHLIAGNRTLIVISDELN